MITEVFAIIFALLIYIGICTVISAVIKSSSGGRKPFWWVFFFGAVGAIITILLDIRDKQ